MLAQALKTIGVQFESSHTTAAPAATTTARGSNSTSTAPPTQRTSTHTMFDERSNSDYDIDQYSTTSVTPGSSAVSNITSPIPSQFETMYNKQLEGDIFGTTDATIQQINNVQERASKFMQFLNWQEAELDTRAKAQLGNVSACESDTQIVDYNDGSKYKGELDSNRVRHGRGTYFYPSGTVYKGEWENGGRHGLGVCEFVSQNKYCGYWIQGRREGLGVFCFTKDRKKIDLPIPWKNKVLVVPQENDDRERYEGEFLQDQRHGFGIYYFPDGSCYAGFWQHNRRHGRGMYFFTSGRTYIGEWLNSQRDGYGIMRDQNGQVLYMGEWSNDRKEGNGVQYDNGDWIYAVWKANKAETNFQIVYYQFRGRMLQMARKELDKTGSSTFKSRCSIGFRDIVIATVH